MSDSYVLDASAMLALTDREASWEDVERLRRDAQQGSGQVAACAISLMELYPATRRVSIVSARDLKYCKMQIA